MQASGCDKLGSSPSLSTRLRDRITTFVAELLADLGGAARNRRVLHRLASLSDRELKDIGLWRQDVRDAGLIENGDASRFLLERREARRSARNAFRHRGPAR